MTIEEVNEKRKLARKIGLSGWWLLQDAERAAKVCNGIGAEWFPAWLRGLIDNVCPHLVIVADIHDVRYEIGGNDAARRRADAEFLSNGYMVAEYYYAWYNPGRYVAEFAVRRMHRLLRVSGGKAWKEATKK